MAGVACVLMCVKPACTVCGREGECCCGYCRNLICWNCATDHCAACSAAAGCAPERTAADYEDSLLSTSAEIEESEHDAPSEDDEFFSKLERLWQSVGYGQLDADNSEGRLHRLPIMSRCTVFEPCSGTWRFWGDLATLSYLSDSLQWEIPCGLIVLHQDAKSCLLFRAGADPEPLCPEAALRLLVDKGTACLCLVISPAAEGCEVAHLEMKGDRRSQTRQRGCLDKLLRSLISRRGGWGESVANVATCPSPPF